MLTNTIDSIDSIDSIDAIIKAAERPCPDIVEFKMFKRLSDGKRFSPFGMPWGAKREDFRLVSVGFVYRSHDGTTYGIRYDSADDARAAHAARQSQDSAAFREKLSVMTAEELAEQVAYWLK